MIYVCIAAKNDAATVGLLLWKVRQVFEEFRREYHLLVADDASSDESSEVLEAYQRTLPATMTRHEQPRGYAACVEELLRQALERTDRPRRDCVVTLPADFSISPVVLPVLIKRIESGADVVVGEPADAPASTGMRLVRRTAPWLLKPGLQLGGFRDVLSGVYAFRLITLKSCLRSRSRPLLRTEGRCANAELVARTAVSARQIAVVSITAGTPDGMRPRKERSIPLAASLLRAGRTLQIPAAQTPVNRA